MHDHTTSVFPRPSQRELDALRLEILREEAKRARETRIMTMLVSLAFIGMFTSPFWAL